MDRAAVSEAANGSSNLPGSTILSICYSKLKNFIVIYEVTANDHYAVTKKQFQTHFGHTVSMC